MKDLIVALALPTLKGSERSNAAQRFYTNNLLLFPANSCLPIVAPKIHLHHLVCHWFSRTSFNYQTSPNILRSRWAAPPLCLNVLCVSCLARRCVVSTSIAANGCLSTSPPLLRLGRWMAISAGGTRHLSEVLMPLVADLAFEHAILSVYMFTTLWCHHLAHFTCRLWLGL